MISAVLDSTVVIDHLNGIPPAREIIDEADSPAISIITWIEVMAGLREPEEEQRGRLLLSNLAVVPLSQEIAEETVRLRRISRLKLPDAVILATAHHLGVALVTRNTKDFDATDSSIIVPYQV